MADIRIVHPETGGEAVVSPDAFEHHLRQSGWMTPEELAAYQALVAEREQAVADAAKATAKSKTESEGK